MYRRRFGLIGLAFIFFSIPLWAWAQNPFAVVPKATRYKIAKVSDPSHRKDCPDHFFGWSQDNQGQAVLLINNLSQISGFEKPNQWLQFDDKNGKRLKTKVTFDGKEIVYWQEGKDGGTPLYHRAKNHEDEKRFALQLDLQGKNRRKKVRQSAV